MMEAGMMELARRAVACKAWRWMPGMLAMVGNDHGAVRITDGQYNAGDKYVCGFWECPESSRGGRNGVFDGVITGALPTFSDPATLGCLLALVREAWGPCSVMYHPMGGRIDEWWVVTYQHNAPPGVVSRRLGVGPTEASALVHALESAF